jgi:hypothetical protein
MAKYDVLPGNRERWSIEADEAKFRPGNEFQHGEPPQCWRVVELHRIFQDGELKPSIDPAYLCEPC